MAKRQALLLSHYWDMTQLNENFTLAYGFKEFSSWLASSEVKTSWHRRKMISSWPATKYSKKIVPNKGPNITYPDTHRSVLY